MKKLGIAAAGLLAVALIFFFTLGSSELRSEAKAQLNQELAALEQNGFSIEKRISKEEEDHFILTFKEPKKIAHYFTAQGTPATAEDIDSLKGMKMGADVYYVKDAYSALSVDLYPVKLPDSLYDSAETKEDKALLEQIQKMLDEKKLLVHIDVAKDFTHFKGYMKDIDQTFKGEESLTIQTKGLTFNGEIKNDRIALIDQKLKEIRLKDDQGGEIVLSKMTTQHKMTGPSLYDIDALYTIEDITMKQGNGFVGKVKDIHVSTSEKVTDGLLQSHVDATIKELQAQADTESFSAKEIHWDARLDNIDIQALEALQNLDPEKDDAAIEKAFAQLLGKGIKLTVNDLSIKEIIENQKSLGGMSMNATLGIDKNVNLTVVQQNPFLLLGAVDANITLKLSDALFAKAGEDPRAMMLMMLIPPKEDKGQKVYTVIMKNGQTTVNGVGL